MKKMHIILIIIIIIGFLSYMIIFYPSLFPIFCIKNDFPETYDKNTVVISSFLGTMKGGYDIVIYGNGSFYYLNRFHQSETKTGTISEKKINEIIFMFRDKGFFCLNENYEPLGQLTDLGTRRISITIGDKAKTVEEYGDSAPSQFLDIFKVLENSATS